MSNETGAALVTGGTRGLGRALSLALARRGLTVYATGRDAGDLRALEEEARAYELPVVALRADQALAEDNAAVVAAIRAGGQPLRLVIHNASRLGPRVPLADYPPEDFDAVLAVNVRGPFDLQRRLDPLLEAGATVLVVTSGVGVVGRAGWGAYSVSKFAIEGMAQIWADELKERGVRVHVVDPGAMRTRMRAEAFPEEDPQRLLDPAENVRPFLWLALEGGELPTGQRFKSQAFPY